MGNLSAYIHDEMEKTTFIMEWIKSTHLSIQDPAISKFIEITNVSDMDLLDVKSKIESNSSVNPKEFLRMMHFLYEVFDAADEVYDVFLKFTNENRED